MRSARQDLVFRASTCCARATALTLEASEGEAQARPFVPVKASRLLASRARAIDLRKAVILQGEGTMVEELDDLFILFHALIRRRKQQKRAGGGD